MKKFYSLLLLFIAATVSFAASAQETVTLKFSIPDAVEKITYNSNDYTLTGGQVTLEKDGYANPRIYLNDGYALTQATNETQGSTLDLNDLFEWSASGGYYTYYFGYSLNKGISSGDTVLLTVGEKEEVEPVTLTFVCDNSKINVTNYAYSYCTVTKTATGYTVNVPDPMASSSAYLMVGFNGAVDPTRYFIESVTANGTPITSYTYLYLNEYKEDTTFVITIGENAPTVNTYTVNCSADVLSFAGGSGETLDVEYANGVYTVSGFTSSVDISIAADYKGLYKMTKVSTESNSNIWFNPSTNVFSPYLYSYPTGTAFTIEVEKIASVLIKVNDRSVITSASYAGYTYAFGEDNTLNFPMANPMGLQFQLTEGNYVLSATSPNGNVVVAYPETGLPANPATITFFDFNDGDEIEVTFGPLAAGSDVVYTIQCPADVLNFTVNNAPYNAYTYAAGAYALTAPAQAATIAVSLKENSGYEIESVTDADDRRLSVDYGTFNIVTTDYPESTAFTVALKQESEEQLITLNVNDQNGLSVQVMQTWVVFENNTATFDLSDLSDQASASLNLWPTQNSTITAVTVNGVAATCTPALPFGTSGQYTSMSMASLKGGDVIDITVSIEEPEPRVFNFTGVAGLSVMYKDVAATYADGVYTVSNLADTDYDSVEISVPSPLNETLELVSVTAEGYDPITPSDGKIYVASYEFITTTNFVINTQQKSATNPGVESTVTIKLMNGQPSQVFCYAGDSYVSFYGSTTQVVDFNTGSTTFLIGSYSLSSLYSVEVDGVAVPEELWQWNSSEGGSCFTLTPDCGYYPTENGTIEIYVDEPSATNPVVTFQFVNDNTEGFISDLLVGSIYLRDTEFTDAVENGLDVAKGTYLGLTFNTADYNVNSMTVNGTAISGNSYSTTVDEDLTFIFDVTMVGGNTVTINSDGWQHLVVTDPDRNTYELTSASTEITFASSVERLFFNAEEGWEIPTIAGVGGIEVKASADADPEYITAGNPVFVADGMVVNVTVRQQVSASEKTLYVYCEADVMTFTGGTAGMGNPDRMDVTPNAVYTEGTGSQPGYYTVTNLSEYLGIAVAEDAREDYKLDNVSIASLGTVVSYNRISVEFATSRIPNGEELTVNFYTYVEPVNITINVNNPTYISRVYGRNSAGDQTPSYATFPATYNLNDGTDLYIEARTDFTVTKVAYTAEGSSNEVVLFNGTPAQYVNVSIADVPEGATVMITAAAPTGDFEYTFLGAEGLSIVYNGVAASYKEGTTPGQGSYKLTNLYVSSLGNYNIQITVAPGYQNKLVLEEVSVEGNANSPWTTVGASQEIIIPGNQLPAAFTTFTVTTRVPAASETTRTVYLTVDNVNAIQDAFYRNEAGRFSFSADGKYALTIKPGQTEVEIQTVEGESIYSITTDVAGTLTLPPLPSSDVVLFLDNAVDGQTINLITEQSAVEYTITLGTAPEVTVEGSTATVTVEFTISETLVGKELTVTVNGDEDGKFTPEATTGTFTVSLTDLDETETVYLIGLEYGDVSDEVEVTVAADGILKVFADENGEIVVYTLQGVRVNPNKLAPGYYIVNGHKVLIK